MEVEGVAFDKTCFSTLCSTLQKRLNDISNEASKILGHPILLTSSPQVGKAIYDELKLSQGGGKTTSTGKKSTAKPVLRKIQHPFVDLVLSYRKISKYLSSWLSESSLARYGIISPKHKSFRIHANWVQCGTATGRLACEDPNLQNLPREPLKLMINNNEIKITVRNAITCAKGNTLIGADYSQIEMRILAHMTKDKKLQQFFNEGKDIHLLISSYALGKPIEKVTQEERSSFKQVVFGILYGMGPKTLGDILKISMNEAQKFIDKFLGKFPTIREFIKTTHENAKREGEIRTLLGRRRLIDYSDTGKGDRQALNSIIQGSAADVIKTAMINIEQAIQSNTYQCKECKLVLQLHDELVYEAPLEVAQGMKKLLREKMENAIHLLVPLTTSMEQGTQWGDMTEVPVKDTS